MSKVFRFRQRSQGGREGAAAAAPSVAEGNLENEQPDGQDMSAVISSERKKDWILKDLRGDSKSDMDVMCALLSNFDIQNLADMPPG